MVSELHPDLSSSLTRPAFPFSSAVSILIGMPDWPTSVLCGIMGLPLIPILIGTLPILLLQAPTLLIGFFTYMSQLKTSDDESGKEVISYYLVVMCFIHD